MYKKDARQLKINAILSWVFTVGFLGYYAYLGISSDFELTPFRTLLVIACIVCSIMYTVRAISAAKEEKNEK